MGGRLSLVCSGPGVGRSLHRWLIRVPGCQLGVSASGCYNEILAVGLRLLAEVAILLSLCIWFSNLQAFWFRKARSDLAVDLMIDRMRSL